MAVRGWTAQVGGGINREAAAVNMGVLRVGGVLPNKHFAPDCPSGAFLLFQVSDWNCVAGQLFKNQPGFAGGECRGRVSVFGNGSLGQPVKMGVGRLTQSRFR